MTSEDRESFEDVAFRIIYCWPLQETNHELRELLGV
jgi:hypothetical protein